MSESVSGEQLEADFRDFEQEFYSLMAEHPELHTAAVADVSRDFFDGAEGDQAGIMSDGNVGVLFTCSQKGAVLLAGTIEHWVDHGCPEAIQLALYVLTRLGAQLQLIQDQFTDVDGFKPFMH